MATTRIKITAINCDTPAKIYLQKFLLLRTCEKVGDEEVVNNYQLGKLNEAKSYGAIDFVKLNKKEDMEFKDYVVTYRAKGEETRLLHTRCFRANSTRDAEDAFFSYFGEKPLEIVSIAEKTDRLSDEDAKMVAGVLDTVRLFTYWNEELGKYEFQGELATMIFCENRMKALVNAIGVIAGNK